MGTLAAAVGGGATAGERAAAGADTLYLFKCTNCTMKEGMFTKKWLDDHKKMCRKMLSARQKYVQDRDA